MYINDLQRKCRCVCQIAFLFSNEGMGCQRNRQWTLKSLKKADSLPKTNVELTLIWRDVVVRAWLVAFLILFCLLCYADGDRIHVGSCYRYLTTTQFCVCVLWYRYSDGSITFTRRWRYRTPAWSRYCPVRIAADGKGLQATGAFKTQTRLTCRHGILWRARDTLKPSD